MIPRLRFDDGVATLQSSRGEVGVPGDRLQETGRNQSRGYGVLRDTGEGLRVDGKDMRRASGPSGVMEMYAALVSFYILRGYHKGPRPNFKGKDNILYR
uniref:Uncharacterized protein n=1 Tax=Oryza sativa subsp. japonica TaxID=39947 RepID=Q6K283_ORYSJ|nr:hypothetical protein [Oryza sativa Japonica Group]